MNQEMLRTGLVSVTFRALEAQRIIELVKQARLDAIEWGGDVHVPHGDLPRAREVRRVTLDAGISIAAYGSYYRAGVSENADKRGGGAEGAGTGVSFAAVLETAIELSAPTVRVWAGNKASADASAGDREAVVADLHRITRLASAAGVTISLEYHPSTLTDTIESARALLELVPEPSLLTLWQPPVNATIEHCIASLRSVLDRLGNIHVYHWDGPEKIRRPLSEGAPRWNAYLDLLRPEGRSRYLLLEFVRDDSPEQFLADAATLRQWVGE